MEANWAEEDQFPWQVSIKAQSIPNRGPVFCSGTIVTSYWVLTSATCISRASIFEIRYDSILHYTGGRVFTSYEAYIHPFFNASNNQNNVALIYSPSLPASNRQILFLPRSLGYPDLTRNTTVVVGWGRSSSLQQISPLLQFAYGQVAQKSACRYNWNGTADDRNDILCVGFRTQRRCAGDTGSPLLVQKQRVWYLVGVAAFDAGLDICQHSLTLFSPLYTFRQWVANVTQTPLI